MRETDASRKRRRYLRRLTSSTGNAVPLTVKTSPTKPWLGKWRKNVLPHHYKVPVMKIVIGGPPPEPDRSLIPTKLRPVPDLVPGARAAVTDSTIPTFELQRGSATTDPEIEWLINGLSFDPAKPMISPKLGSEAAWRIRNGGGGWVHPMHLHMEEHRTVARNGVLAPDARHPDDSGKEDVVALDPSEDVVISRRFRSFVGPYVAHCHNLAHEDHSMMFGWDILP